MSFNTNLGGEESEQSLPSWISDHLGAKSYIDETTQYTSSSIPTSSLSMDTSSLTKESNVMSQVDLDNLGTTYSFPPGVRLRIPGDGETILSARQGEFALPPAVPQRVAIGHMFAGDLAGLQTSPILWRIQVPVLPQSPARLGVELAPGAAASESLLRVLRSWGTPGKSCNKLPTLSEVDAKRMEAIFGKIEPGGYFEEGPSRHPCELFKMARREGKGSVANLLSGTSGSSSDSGSDSISDSELPPELRSDAMSARGKAVAEKARRRRRAKHPPKGSLFARNVREKAPLIEIGEEDSSKGKEPCRPRRLKVQIQPRAINARGRAAERGPLPPGDGESNPLVVYAFFSGPPQQELSDIDFHMARADSAELELVKAQKRAIKAETRVAELNEENQGPAPRWTI
ncbi:hypothetical protein Acr_00g0037720 [Actinidia rufa]|uniref:Uncharacterized protein n=1 Tax=Actinidia rufa TaxID=165716 RepID=A0A7J0DI56_9ERIC|nr:hypothetical protein Acr_00g0037720 [Actinidia rufa]